MQVVAFVTKVEHGKHSAATVHNPADLSIDQLQQASAAISACEAATAAKQPAAAQCTALARMLKLMVHTNAAAEAADIVEDFRATVAELFGSANSTGATPGQPPAGTGAAVDAQAQSDSDESRDVAEQASANASWINRLTECLLGLLADSHGSVPVAALRSNVEGVWRAVSGHVNAVALADVLAVVTQHSSSSSSGAATAESEEEEEGAASEDAGASSVENSSSDKESSDTDGHPAANATQGAAPGVHRKRGRHRAVHDESGGSESDSDAEDHTLLADAEGSRRSPQASQHSADGSTDARESDADSEAADDEQMFRMDQHLVKYFRSIRANKEVRPPALQAARSDAGRLRCGQYTIVHATNACNVV